MILIPGENPNPRWDRTDPLNAHAVAAMFAAHLFVNISFTVIVYVILKCRSNGTHHKLNSIVEMMSSPSRDMKKGWSEEKYSLLQAEDDEDENEL